LHLIERILRILHIMLKGNIGEVLDMTLRILHMMMRGDGVSQFVVVAIIYMNHNGHI